MTIKNDKARKAWLAGLKDGDGIATMDDAGSVLGIGTVTRSLYTDEFRVESIGCFTSKLGKGGRGHRGAHGCLWLVPLTEDMRAAFEKRKAADRARSRIQSLNRFGGMPEFSDDQALAAAAILWPAAEGVPS